MKRWKLTFEYDGTNFRGWQRQPEGRTVEGVIEQAFSTLYQREIDIIGQGRTDAGVHALGQTAHVDLPEKYSARRIVHAMRGLLPEDAALLKAETVEADFHARFHAKSRSYCYRISEKQAPINRHSVWTYERRLNEERLKTCAEIIRGEHNFLNFCIPPEEEHATTICFIKKSEWTRENGLLVYRIEADRFLRHMVRRLVGSMLKVADGTLTPVEFQELLSANNVKQKGHAAPASGLVLVQVVY